VSTFTWDELGDGVVLLTMDDPGANAITMNDWFLATLRDTVDALVERKEQLSGVVVTSAKPTFSAGGDLTMMVNATAADAGTISAYVRRVKQEMRRLETLGLPVAAAINGAALGGGLELALVCHHRVALDAPGTRIGLPEIGLGLLPGGGGVTRVVRMLGLKDALSKVLMSGRQFSAPEAQALGLVDEVVGSREELVAAAKAWVLAHPEACQPWERAGWTMPGGAPATSRPALPGVLAPLTADLRRTTKGAPALAERNLLAAAVEGAALDLDTALEVESQYCVELICGQQSSNIIRTMFFDVQSIGRGASRPQGQPAWQATKAVVLGAGMMGAGIAYSCARAGMQVVLTDTSLEAAQRGKAYSERLLAKAVERGGVTEQERDALLARITPTATLDEHLAGADLVVEAVFEDPGVKADLFTAVEPLVAPDALLASNTSTLPITGLAGAVTRPEDFVGLHFFSPVDKMPLVEVVVGEKTSDAALARAFDVVRQLRKTPIVVNDSRGFFTSRVIIRFVLEAVAMVAEGVAPASIEQAALQAGYPTGPLALLDELAMPLLLKIRDETAAAARARGAQVDEHPAYPVLAAMVGLGRHGRAAGRGFYDYADGARGGIWPGLAELYPRAQEQPPFADLQERMLFAESLDAVRCLDEGVLRTVADANVGSVLGIGFPRWTGGVLRYVDQYGVADFVRRADELKGRYGARFEPPPSLRERAERGETFG
jgi:3-hydroxyacyl-CoA dehydrogenase/enoyl-CoA hydratase/3-hydroxybutyryl-CoA epimerase